MKRGMAGKRTNHGRTMLLGVAVMALVFAGCGSTLAPKKTAARTTTTTTSTTTTTTNPTKQPTLGSPNASHCQGCGQVEPSEINMEGDPTSIVSNIQWKSWGGPQATGIGTGWYVEPNQIVAQGTHEAATVVAFNLGNCGSTYGYQAVIWYFPQYGETFSPSDGYYNTCTGEGVGL